MEYIDIIKFIFCAFGVIGVLAILVIALGGFDSDTTPWEEIQ